MTDIPTESPPKAPATTARRLVRAAGKAALATRMAEGEMPYASLVTLACDQAGAPILLLSDLAEHSKNLAASTEAALLVDGTAGLADPLTGARVTVMGRLIQTEAPAPRARFLARHPSAALYADFNDFNFYRMEVTRAHLVAGFGEIHWIDGAALSIDAPPALIAAEPDILAHMNTDHADALALMAARLASQPAGDWQMCGIDPEGCDLTCAKEGAAPRSTRIDFAAPIEDAAQARAALVALTKQARAKQAGA